MSFFVVIVFVRDLDVHVFIMHVLYVFRLTIITNKTGWNGNIKLETVNEQKLHLLINRYCIKSKKGSAIFKGGWIWTCVWILCTAAAKGIW